MEAVHYFLKNLSILYRHTQMEMAKGLEPLGIGMGQYAYIIALCEAPGITQDGLTSRLLYNKSSVARATAYLEEGGFLLRETDPADKRSYRLYPTEKGKEARELIRQLVQEQIEAVTAVLQPEEKETTAAALEKMAGGIARDRQCPQGQEAR